MACSLSVASTTLVAHTQSPVTGFRQAVASSSTLRSFPSTRRAAPLLKRGVRAEVAVQLGGGSASEHNKVAVGDKVRVSQSVKVFHVPGVKELDLEGTEGIVKDVLGVYKGTPVSANLPYKVAFETEVNGAKKKFFVHFKDDEIELS
ncbi:hypothetical protein CLOM_g14597 [Closterium sp. NIES-68]|nr:hypothetical protein CLOM_g14597 [Closterium sp. NIES-68]GJP82440.1 hypothetical protein CLOP_g12699 [Closterium sp. NIES-67]